MLIQDRSYAPDSNSYRFGFNGMEQDDKVKGKGNSLDFGSRIYDGRLGRWLGFDPLSNNTPDLAPYHFVENSPTNAYDPDGKSGIVTVKRGFLGIGKRVIVESNLYFYGGASGNNGNGIAVSNKENAKQVAQRIQNDMNKSNGTITLNDGKTYRVKYKVKGKHITRGDAREMIRNNNGSDAAKNNFIAVVSDGYSATNNQQTRNAVGGNFGYITINDYANPQANRTTPTHEFVHGQGWFDPLQSGTNEFDGTINNGTHDYVGTVIQPTLEPVSVTVGALFEDGANVPPPPYNIPGIMTPRGATASSMSTGNVPMTLMEPNGTIDENQRSVNQRDINLIFNQNVIDNLSNNGNSSVGRATNLIYMLNTSNFQVP